MVMMGGLVLAPLGKRRRHIEIGSFVVAPCAAGAVRASIGLSNTALIDMYATLALIMGPSIDVSHTSPTNESGALP